MRTLRLITFAEPDLIAPQQGGIKQCCVMRRKDQLCAGLIDYRVLKYFDQTADEKRV